MADSVINYSDLIGEDDTFDVIFDNIDKLKKELNELSKIAQKDVSLINPNNEKQLEKAVKQVDKLVAAKKILDKEEKQAITWFYTAANNGHRGAMVWLGKTYIFGFARHNIERNYYEARIWLERAIEGKDDIVYKHFIPFLAEFETCRHFYAVLAWPEFANR